MSRTTDKVSRAVIKGLTKRGAPHKRAERVYRLLLADGPLSSKEIMERLDMTYQEVCGSGQAMEHLLADGRVFSVLGHGNSKMYYAEEELK